MDCTIDQYVEASPEPWPQWMDRRIEDADFVLVLVVGVVPPYEPPDA